MNILFYSATEVIKEAGGVENVTAFWYTYFQKKGIRCGIVFWKKHPYLDADLPQTQLPDQNSYYSPRNVDFLTHYLKENKIDILINQFAVNNTVSRLCTDACDGSDVRLISVMHNMPDVMLRTRGVTRKMMQYPFTRRLLIELFACFQKSPFQKGGKYIYDHSDRIVLLSKAYIPLYQKINSGEDRKGKITALPNPLTIQPISLPTPKNRTVLFVGRLTKQKAVDKLLLAWHEINAYVTAHDWKLVLLGDGEERALLDSMVRDLSIRNVEFKGHTSPEKYYQTAKIFCMTSIYEGFPMTLIECQAYGVVPIVYNSFAAATDIITQGINGFTVDVSDTSEYARRLLQMMEEPDTLSQLSEACRERVKEYLPDAIFPKWMKIFNSQNI